MHYFISPKAKILPSHSPLTQSLTRSTDSTNPLNSPNSPDSPPTPSFSNPSTPPTPSRCRPPQTVAFHAFWHNRVVPASGVGLQRHYIQAVAQVVNRTMHRDTVIGWEIMNEP